MSRLKRGEPMDMLQEEAEDTEVIERIFNAVKAFLPRDRQVVVLRGLNKRLANEIVAQEDRSQSPELDRSRSQSPELGSERRSPVPRMLGHGASLRDTPGILHQQQEKQGKRANKDVYHRGIPGPKPPTKNDLDRGQSRVGIRSFSQPSYREKFDSSEDDGNSSDGTDDSDVDDAHASRPAPCPTGKAGKQRQRSVRMIRSTTLADPTVIQSALAPVSQTPTAKPASHLEIVAQRNDRGQTVYKCPKCPQTKQWRRPVVEHMVWHGAQGTFKCKECDFATSNQVSFNWHLKVHLEPSQRKWGKRTANRNKCPNPSESDAEISPGRMPISKNIGHPGIPCGKQGSGDVATTSRAVAEHMLRAGQSTSGIPHRRAEPGELRIAEFRCSDCPEAFLFKTHLKLHRRNKHPMRNRQL